MMANLPGSKVCLRVTTGDMREKGRSLIAVSTATRRGEGVLGRKCWKQRKSSWKVVVTGKWPNLERRNNGSQRRGVAKKAQRKRTTGVAGHVRNRKGDGTRTGVCRHIRWSVMRRPDGACRTVAGRIMIEFEPTPPATGYILPHDCLN